MEGAVRFYEEGFGIPRVNSGPDVAFFSLNGTWLGLYGWDVLAEDARFHPKGTDSQALPSHTTSIRKTRLIVYWSRPSEQELCL